MAETEAEILMRDVAEGRVDAESLGAKLAEMVEAEASAAESETPEDEEIEGSETEEMQPSDPLTAALAEYIGNVSEILGPDAPIMPCAYCRGMGFNPIELKADSHSNICEDCDGFGEVLTGSKVKGNESRMCPTCKGSGYIAEIPIVVVPDTGDVAASVHLLSDDEIAAIVADAQTRAGSNVG